MKSNKLQIVILTLIAIIALLFMSTGLIIDIKWFQEVGYVEVFFTKLMAISKLLIPIFIFYFLVIWIYFKSLKKSILKVVGHEHEKKVNKIGRIVNLLIALIGAITTSATHWYKILQFTNSVDFNSVDPVFNKDVSFYVFKLPLIQSIYDAVFMLLIILVGITLITYFGLNIKDKLVQEGNVIRINSGDGIKNFAGKQLAIVSAILVILVGLGYILKAYYLVYSTRGVAYGASYTDVNITLKFYRVITIAAIIAGFVVFFSVLRSKFKPIVISIAAIGVLIVVEPVTALFVQQFIVNSNEMGLEREYIQYNIDATKEAFNIDEIEEKSFEPKKELTIDQLANNQDIIDNLKVNSTDPVLSFYQQVQLIKNYYKFNDTDTDRYNINGDYTQVFIAPREINSDAINTWQNKHLRYTHGYGTVMSKVNTVTSEGQPSFVMNDIPTVNLTDIGLENPRIYYGEATNDYVIVNTKDGEFDYPTGEEENIFFYDGTGGIPMTFFNKLLFAIKEQNPKILFSSVITDESRMILDRNIVERVNKIAPFLQLDNDPYMVINDGRLFWMMDAYTATNKYPFSEPHYGVNYIRNSVKIVVDAYNGTVDFYIVDENDPIVQTYSKIYKGLFKPMSEMPEGLKEHFKYPQDIFTIQSEVLAKYHVNDPNKLYTEEDLWDKSKVTLNNGSSSANSQMPNNRLNQTLQMPQNNNNNENTNNESLYLMTRLPGEENLEMMLLEYFNMKGKQSMVGLLGARMDGDNYGKLIMYKFPPQRTVYSPTLFKNRIQQDPEISKEVSLWEGKGSQVIYGDIIVVPIEDSLLYLNTIYLKADAENSMPEMKRVILSNGDKIVIEENVEKALEKLFNYKTPTGEVAPEDKNDGEAGTETENPSIEKGSIKEASDLFNKALEAQKNGDWAAYGQYIDEVGKLLESLSE